MDKIENWLADRATWCPSDRWAKVYITILYWLFDKTYHFCNELDGLVQADKHYSKEWKCKCLKDD